ncbi:Oxygen-evolving enhancer protein 3-2 [Hibiscus syriacus]|uniref:Oxygen-evolving enhancer protein 3-2 n=1 Tax=Hibiscus syriacus TaxID=106335 RepID=A0A6A3C1S0_HIBSY|nr:Oxygen-evolving enhancer protein 3-2 [Hibiscus syriacus]
MAADMAQAMASMAGLLGSSQALNIGSNNRLAVTRPGFTIRAQQAPTETETGRRAMLGLVAAGLATGSFVQAVLADARSIKLGPPPPPSGGLRKSSIILAIPTHLLMIGSSSNHSLRLRQLRGQRILAKDILGVKSLIDKKAWPYVMNDLQLKAEYLRYDLKTVISSKPKDEKKSLNELTKKLFNTIDGLDHAAKIKSTPKAEKYYAETASALNDVIAKLG